MLDIISLSRDVMALIRDQELQAAEHIVSQAARTHAEESGRARSETINQINIELKRIKLQRDALRQTVKALPEKERVFAEVQIEEIIDKIFTNEIAELKAMKRKLSRPG